MLEPNAGENFLLSAEERQTTELILSGWEAVGKSPPRRNGTTSTTIPIRDGLIHEK